MNCRVCGHDLETVLDLGEQALSGQFPRIGEPDPPRFPLVLARCVQCKLMQLRDTVDPKLMFTKYGYRSGVTATMREHLRGISEEATNLLASSPPYPGHTPAKVLDIGANDGTLLQFLNSQEKWAIDPSDVPSGPATENYIKGFYPHEYLIGQKFDLIFSIACFYDVNDPVAFARAVRDNLAPGGLWCVEVSDVNAVLAGAWDSICHEHVTYFSFATLLRLASECGFRLVKSQNNACNGGSVRCYFASAAPEVPNPPMGGMSIDGFAEHVQYSKQQLRDFLQARHEVGEKVHLLGASTKANTVLQYCGLNADLIQYASDRDPRKVGCCTPGTRIPIISEAESRAMKPDVYVCLLHGFKDEVVAREVDFLARGGTILFPLPTFTEVKA